LAGKSKEIRVQPPCEASQFLDTAQLLDDPLYPFIPTAFNPGMRQPELRALLWDDINLESKSVCGDKQIKRKRGGGLVFALPKSEAGKVTIELD